MTQQNSSELKTPALRIAAIRLTRVSVYTMADEGSFIFEAEYEILAKDGLSVGANAVKNIYRYSGTQPICSPAYDLISMAHKYIWETLFLEKGSVHETTDKREQ